MALGQTVTVVNKSGKVVSTGKHVVNVFKEAKSAYRERKAEIKAVRDAEFEQKRAQKALEKLAIEDDHASQTSSRRSSKSRKGSRSHHERPPVDRGYSDSFYANDRVQSQRSRQQSRLRNEFDLDGERQHNELVRRHTTHLDREVSRPNTSRSASEADIDMDLAYGELPPPLPERPHDEEIELRSKMTKLQQLLDEANCVQHSVVATIENLQKNPDALAAVALTLGEISTMAGKMAPGVLTSMKTAFPAIIALLASPQFMIAAGVGVGVTVIAFGGYKIIKKIQKRKEDAAQLEAAGPQRQLEDNDSVSEYDELCELDSDLSRIEVWRRGIADAEAQSLGTSVDGEFITPGAGRALVDEGVLRAEDLKSTRSSKSHKTSKSKKSKKEPKSEKVSTASSKDKEKRKKKDPSGLRMLFKTRV